MTKIIQNMLLTNQSDWHNTTGGQHDGFPEHRLGPKNALSMMSEGSMPHVRKNTF